MTGVYRHNIDAKGRLSIPSKLKDELGDVFYVTISSEPCLVTYSLKSWEEMEERVAAMPRLEQKRVRPMFAHAARVEVDSQGRILLPQELRKFAGLVKNVAVVGMGRYTEFWDEAAWNAVDEGETTPENLASVCRELGI